MDRGWHHSACSGPERPRLGQQPYDRGRGVSNDRRGCYHCGQDGHMKKFCPQLDGRYGDTGRLMERSAWGGSIGRRCNDSRPSSRSASSVGKEHGYSRNDSLREGSGSRRSHFDYHESGDFSQRPRDNADRHRDNEGRGHGIVAASSASVRERDTKSSRSSSRKPAGDEHYPGAGGHRGEERRDNRSKECESNLEKLAANGDVVNQYPPSRLLAAEGNSRVKTAVHEDKLMSEMSESDVKLGTNGNIADVKGNSRVPSLDEHVASVSQREPEGPVRERGSFQPSNKGGERELEYRVDQASRSRVSNKRLSNAKLPLSVLCKDAAEGNLERKYKNENSVFSPLVHVESVVVVEPVLPLSSEKHSGMQDRSDDSVLVQVSASVERVEPILPSSAEGPLDRKLGIDHTVLSSVVENGAHVEPPSGGLMNGHESCTEGQLDYKVDCPSLLQTEESMGKIEDCKIANFTDDEPPDRGCTKDKSGREGKAVSEYSGQPDVQGLSGRHGQSAKGRRVSRWGTRREEDQSRGSGGQSAHVLVQVADSVPDAAKDLERALPSGMNAAEQVCESKGHRGLAKETSHFERDGLSHKSQNGTPGSVRNWLSKEKDNETLCHRRDLEPDCRLKDDSSEYQGVRVGLDYGPSADGVREKDALGERCENLISTCTVTTLKLRNDNKDRDISHDSHTGLSSREGSVDRTSERNGFYRYGGRTGLKDVYRRHDYVGDYDRAGARDRLGNSSELCAGDDPREHRGWGLDWRHSRNWEAYPGHSQYLPGSYVNVCNARYLQSRMLSPAAASIPSSQAVVPLDPVFSSSHGEEVHDDPMESQSKGWMFRDVHGNLQGPVGLGELKESMNSGKLPSDYMVQHEGSNEWVTLEHAQNPVNSSFSVSPIEIEQLPAAISPRVSILAPQVCAPIVQESYQEGAYNAENSDEDICPPGTEACAGGHNDENYEDFHIDERIERLMNGVNLIAGKEKQIVHDVLWKASSRVRQECESDIAVEESPRSHGGFADMGDQWKDGDFGSDVQGLEGFGFDQQVTKVDVKAGDAVTEVRSDGGTDVVSAPGPTSAVNCSAERTQESWEWTARGGDWKLVHVVDNVQQTRGDAPGLSDKGHAGYFRKVVVNRGFPVCETQNSNLRDPRKQHQESWKVHLSESRRLLLPKFAQKSLASKLGSSAGDHHTIYNQQSAPTPKRSSATTPRSQGSTPRAVLSTPAKDHSASIGPLGVSKTSKADTPFVNGELCGHKRKACSVEDAEPSKQHRKSIQRACILDVDESVVDRKSARISHVTHVVDSTMPPLIDDNPSKVSEVGPIRISKHLDDRVQEQNWANLEPGLLRLVFRSLRGDVKTLVNAMATCKSWSSVGKRCKAELKRADLSSVRDQSLDAVLESLPGFGGGKLRRIILKGCTVSPESLGHLLRACPSISAVEMGCNEPLKELIRSFPKVRWLGGHTGLQSPRERITFRREDSHLKTRSLKLIAKSRDSHSDFMSRDGDESEIHSVSDSASKVRSPFGYSCLISADVEASTNESVHNSEITHLTHGSRDGVKHLKLNNGSVLIKSNGLNGSMKTVKQENGIIGSRLQLKRKALAASSHRKYEKSAFAISKQVFKGHRALADKHSSPSGKPEHHSKSASLSLFEGDKSLEKEMATVLRVMMDADTDKCFQSANIVSNDGKGSTWASGKTVDLLMIEKKLKGGAYAGGKVGFKAFKEDVNLLIRTAFRNDKDKATYSTAEKIFKLALQHFASLDSQIAGTLPHAKTKNLSMRQHRPGKKRKSWDDDGVQKGKFTVNKKGRQGESSSGDVDSDATEHETRRFSKPKKVQWWESEVDSSEEDEESGFMEEDEEEEETEASDSDVPSESEGEDGIFEDENDDTEDEQLGYHDWGARMTKAAMVPPVTRKYVVIEEYRIVADKERVEQKMKVELPRDYEEKLQAAKEKRSDNYTHLDIPEMKDYKPRKKLGEEVFEQEVYGIDPHTHNLLLDTMPVDVLGFSESQKQQFIEERLLLALNKEARQYTGSGKAPMEYSLEKVVERISTAADISKDWALHEFSEQLLNNIRSRPKDKFVAYRKGLGVVCNKYDGLDKDEFVVEFFGEVYPPWRWYEKQDGIRSLQKKEKDTTPEFYNIFYERPKGDAAGYDLLVVDAMHKANFASRLCHSCRPNCEAKITAVNNTYMIGVYTLKPIKHGEELTFDYNSVTESKEEYDNAICLCGSQGCRGSYLNLTGSGTFEEIILKNHGLLDRHDLLLDSCIPASVQDVEWQEMRQAGLGTSLLSGLPTWVLKYAARLVHFMNYEKTHLPAELLKDLELKRKQGVIEGCTELDAEITTEGVYNQRLQNLAITLDKVRHILTRLYKDPSLAPPPLRKLDPKDMVQWIWKRDDSVVSELLQCLSPHLAEETLLELKQGISKNVPHDGGFDLKDRLLWLRDTLRRLPATCKARHDAAADLIHVYAYTKFFFTLEDYAIVESTSITILPLDLGSSRHSLSGPKSWHKTYSREYVWGQLINWYKQNGGDPGASLAKAGRGCLRLPDISSCYAKNLQHDFRQGYGQKHRQKMICHMEEKPQLKWPKSKFWSQLWCFKSERGLFGSPMLDSVIEARPLDDQMVKWLKFREDVFVGPWDEQ